MRLKEKENTFKRACYRDQIMPILFAGNQLAGVVMRFVLQAEPQLVK